MTNEAVREAVARLLLVECDGCLPEWLDRISGANHLGSPPCKVAMTCEACAWDDSLKVADKLLALADQGQWLPPFQPRVEPWMRACFGDVIPFDKLERCDRFIEEALELVQTSPMFTADRAHALVDYVFGRPAGEPAQEVGGVMVTLAAWCLAHGLNMHEAGETELARIWTKVEQIRAKQAAKPTGSALPVASDSKPEGGDA